MRTRSPPSSSPSSDSSRYLRMQCDGAACMPRCTHPLATIMHASQRSGNAPKPMPNERTRSGPRSQRPAHPAPLPASAAPAGQSALAQAVSNACHTPCTQQGLQEHMLLHTLSLVHTILDAWLPVECKNYLVLQVRMLQSYQPAPAGRCHASHIAPSPPRAPAGPQLPPLAERVSPVHSGGRS